MSPKKRKPKTTRWRPSFEGSERRQCAVCGGVIWRWRGAGIVDARGWPVCDDCGREHAPKLLASVTLTRLAIERPEVVGAFTVLADPEAVR